ncbi:hypothetical protein HG530_014897 [Fusarium avenaceum]|nr:hypothetical protein HG530_014897 [Fusarium avenaceum]
MCKTHWSTMHCGSAPVAILALQAAAHEANSASTASAVRLPLQHFVKVLSNPLDGILRNVISEKGSTGKSTVDLPKGTHKSHWLALVGLACSDESTEVIIVNLLLYGQICAESFVHEEAVQSSTEFSMCFTLKEDPGAWSHEGLGHGNNAWFDECWGLEDLVCNITIGSENHEPKASDLEGHSPTERGRHRTWDVVLEQRVP